MRTLGFPPKVTCVFVPATTAAVVPERRPT
jgi:hypothetical protein